MISIQDMTELLYIYDAYYRLNATLLGKETAICYHEGTLGALSRIHNLIERNASEKLKEKDNNEIWLIAGDTSKTPEERAKMLLK